MREATEVDYYETMLEYSQAILNAETEEEVQVVREEISEMLMNEYGYEGDGPAIVAYMNQLECWLEKVESGEITTDELAAKITSHFEMESIQSTEESSVKPIQTAGTVGIGIGLAVFLGCMTMKKRILKNKKDKIL